MTTEEKTMNGAALIAAERQRQINAEGYDPSHDDAHNDDSLAIAAVAYALSAPDWWPWGTESFKPGDRLRELAKAGALIAAEIDRLQRLPEDG